ncbi:MAG: thermonuclease family protein [Kofleriaceae bacterium]|nr:thermonuclease family protein [Kofleriaceae bacterium]
MPLPLHNKILLGLIAALCFSACGPSSRTRRYNRAQVQESLERLESPGLVIGEFNLAPKGVVDGDTLKVKGLDQSLRLLAIDTEETYKVKADRRASDADFDAYLNNKKGSRGRPAKAATPLGEDAKKFAKKFFSGVSRVRLERDHPKEIRGRYSRYLAYAFALKNGSWVNYNIEAVRAGMTPYFTKYGFSRRFHKEFIEAENEAREAQIGIWKPGCECYPDYPIRKKWWDGRANFILEFERKASTRDDYIVLTNWDALRRIEEKLGQEVTILATVGDVKYGDNGPSRAMLSRRLFSDFPAIFFDKDVFSSSGIANYKSEFVAITGVVNKYKNKYNNKQVLQLLVNLPSQVSGKLAPDFITPAQPAPDSTNTETSADVDASAMLAPQ